MAMEGLRDTAAAAPKLRKKKKKIDLGKPKIVLYQLVLLAAILGIWELGVRTGVLAIYIYGAPSGVAAAFWEQIGDGTLFRHFWVTGQEVLLGFVIGSAL